VPQFCKYDMDIEITISVFLRPNPAETNLHTAKQYNNKIIMVHDGIYIPTIHLLLFDTTMSGFIVHLYILYNTIIVTVIAIIFTRC